jgi:hypothetical protein
MAAGNEVFAERVGEKRTAVIGVSERDDVLLFGLATTVVVVLNDPYRGIVRRGTPFTHHIPAIPSR